MEQKTHWKKLHNPDYLGAYSLQPGQDMVLTIDTVRQEMVTGTDGKKEECMVMRFTEKVKPMIVNATNAKTMERLFATPYIEDWKGRKIALYIASVKAFGETVDALRVRHYPPKVEQADLKCAGCGGSVEAAGKHTAEQLAGYTARKYGRILCAACAVKAKEAQASEDVL